ARRVRRDRAVAVVLRAPDGGPGAAVGAAGAVAADHRRAGGELAVPAGGSGGVRGGGRRRLARLRRLLRAAVLALTRESRPGCPRVALWVSASRALGVGESRCECTRVVAWVRASRAPAARGPRAGSAGRTSPTPRPRHARTETPTRAHRDRDSPMGAAPRFRESPSGCRRVALRVHASRGVGAGEPCAGCARTESRERRPHLAPT